MLLDFNSIHYNQQDCDLINDNVNEIIELGLKAYKRKHNKELTPYEQVLYNILVENANKCLSKETLAGLYNERVYKENISKYVKPQNITTKINRINRKLKGIKITNKFGYGYYIIVT